MSLQFGFGNVVVVGDGLIGVVVKSWEDRAHDVYVREFNGIKSYYENDMKHYVYSKTLTEEEKKFYG